MADSLLYSRLSALLFAALTATGLLTFQHYGMSWDEELQSRYGESVLRFYTSAFEDKSALTLGDLYYYGGLFEAPAAAATRISPFGVYETRHLLSALCGIFGVLGCWKLVRFMAGPGAAFWSALLLALHPSYYGHMFINSKDIPFAAFYIWGIYYTVRFLAELPRVSMKIAVKAGVATGMTMGVRVGGLLILGCLYLFVTLLCIYWIFWRKVRRGVGRTTAGLTVTTVTAVAVMLASWPYALSKPIVRTWSAVTWFSGHPGLQPSPRDYIPRYLLLKFPELVIVLLSIGFLFGIWYLAKSGALANPLPMVSYLVVIFSALFPIVYSIMRQVPLYDEVRHFLFIIPPLMCLAGITLDRLVQLSLRWKVAGSLLIASVGLFLILQIVQIVQLHPYEYAYYNRVIGGIQGASQNGYPVEYWATSYREGVRQMEAYFRKRDGTAFERSQYRLLLGPAEWCAITYFPPNFASASGVQDADAYLSTTRYNASDVVEGLEVVRIQRFGVPFAIGKVLP